MQDNLSNISTVKELLHRHGFTFSKALGQNFIVNPGICPKMAELSGAKGIGVIEVGPGIGVLTAELAKIARRVVCVELDTRLLPVLAETLAGYDNVTVINADVLKVDLRALIEKEFAGMEVVVCANLPYYITSPIVMSLLEARLPVKAITVMVQKEAAARLCAKPATRDVGAVTIAVRYYSEPRVLFTVSRGSFMPAPEVDSAVIRLDVHETPPLPVKDEKLFFAVVKAAFGMRRKTISNALTGVRGFTKEQVQAVLASADVPPTHRAEQLTMEQFAAIADGIYSR
ncbi:16S rRNA (adenine(1518)-N(6)/adenine(1519)-N(6))-dimethyltransferase RsmA [Acetanaerobacterium elongatum]|uniref:Ribosomal RNA small subunit methyltransferase A n=1 Tax=Acetanaerobacterium elongatum TaxID=258515 RepID=A0A1H0GP14_9FIRM|nr:16S rRNA (adenine(1518)-N(6)/adenine(1519)-N(6))-dimethyltransferase RsmA [Acetanaerobacterium elongatum]SDO08598.1 16S rRNA (adenine1518-N6/adenine1519-N6)-dimethyltransferase [Acetanaerobacterium elongatum]